MERSKDKQKQVELYVIKQLRKGHSRNWVASHLEEEFDYAESSANNIVQRIGGQLNKSLSDLSEDAAQFIYDTLLKTIDDTIEDDDRKNRLKALELLAKVTKVTSDKGIELKGDNIVISIPEV